MGVTVGEFDRVYLGRIYLRKFDRVLRSYTNQFDPSSYGVFFYSRLNTWVYHNGVCVESCSCDTCVELASASFLCSYDIYYRVAFI